FRLAAGVAVGCYGVLLVAVVFLGRMWASPWLLRVPAAASVGLFVLLTLPMSWWGAATKKPPVTGPAHWWTVPHTILTLAGTPTIAVLVAASLGYLVIEARNHAV